ncbi:MAG TPA: hypothetical protein VGR89_03885, partial [Puia sp.]|nr:hypothetical protein [Puia sp.]
RWKTEGTVLYQALPDEMRRHWRPCEPLRPGDPAAADAGKHSHDSSTPDAATPHPDPGPAAADQHPYRPWKETQ